MLQGWPELQGFPFAVSFYALDDSLLLPCPFLSSKLTCFLSDSLSIWLYSMWHWLVMGFSPLNKSLTIYKIPLAICLPQHRNSLIQQTHVSRWPLDSGFLVGRDRHHDKIMDENLFWSVGPLVPLHKNASPHYVRLLLFSINNNNNSSYCMRLLIIVSYYIPSTVPRT